MIRLAEIKSVALGESPIMSLIFPRNPDGKENHQIRANEHIQSMREDETARYVKATDVQSGKIVGWANWRFFEDPAKPLIPSRREWDPPANIALGKYFFGALEERRRESMKGEKYFLMAILMTLPGYQRNGIGGKLLEWGLEQADEKGYRCWIDSSPEGSGLYKKHGWEEIGFSDVDLADWGGEQGVLYRTVHLVRKPKERVERVKTDAPQKVL